MFEILAKDQNKSMVFYAEVFGWTYEIGDSGFAYVRFPLEATPLLGGIGQARPDLPGFGSGCNFYLRVTSLEATIESAVAAGGCRLLPATRVDGFHFAMIRDPEGNAIGLIEPFANTADLDRAGARSNRSGGERTS